MKNGNEAKDALGDSRKRYRARGRDKKVRTALRAKIARFVTVPSEKKKIFRSTHSFEVTSERQGMCSTFFNRRRC